MKRSLFDKLKKDMQADGWSPRHLVAILVFGAIVIVFVFFGMSGKHNAIGSGAVAQVNSELISIGELNQEAQRLEQMYAPMFGGQIQSDAQRQFIKMQALDSLISNELLVQGASAMGILSTDDEVKQIITRDIPAFQNEGRFQRDRYLGLLEANRLTPGEFERRVRKERLALRLRRVFEWVSSPTTLDLQKQKLLRDKKREVTFAKIEKTAVLDKMTVLDLDIQKSLSNQDFAKKVQSEFEVNKTLYGSEEQVKAQHILVKFQGEGAEADAKALSKIKAIADRAKKEDFGKLAAETSEDLGSKSKKGDLGYFTKGKMVPEFEQVAFNQKIGTVSEPVKSEFGYHLIKVLDHKTAIEPKLENVQNKIAKKLIAAEKYDQIFAKLESAIKSTQAAEVDAAIRELGMQWQDSGFFEWGQEVAPGLGSAVATSAALSVSPESPLAKELVRDGAAVYVVKWKADKTEAATDAKADLEANLAREQSYEVMNSWLEDYKKQSQVEKNISDSQRL